jgi:hypothetical protein
MTMPFYFQLLKGQHINPIKTSSIAFIHSQNSFFYLEMGILQYVKIVIKTVTVLQAWDLRIDYLMV